MKRPIVTLLLGTLAAFCARTAITPLTTAAGLAATASLATTSASAQPVGNMATEVVRASPYGPSTTIGGTVVPLKEVTLAAQMPGRVEFIAGVEGDWVDSGKVLVALDDDDLRAQQRILEAQWQTAWSNYRNAEVQYRRQVYAGPGQAESMGFTPMSMLDKHMTRPMQRAMGDNDSDIVYRSQVYNQGTQIDQARANIQQIKAQWQGLMAKLRDTRAIAPFRGAIMSKRIEVGDTVQPGQPLLNFADINTLQVKLDIPARIVHSITVGMTLSTKLDVSKRRFDARVTQVFPMADPQRHTVTVKLDLPNDAPGGPGMYAEVTVPDQGNDDEGSKRENLPVVSSSAVILNGSLQSVVVVNDKNETELRLVRLGNYLNDKDVTILAGVKVGERVLTNPPRSLTSGWSEAPGAAKDSPPPGK